MIALKYLPNYIKNSELYIKLITFGSNINYIKSNNIPVYVLKDVKDMNDSDYLNLIKTLYFWKVNCSNYPKELYLYCYFNKSKLILDKLKLFTNSVEGDSILDIIVLNNNKDAMLYLIENENIKNTLFGIACKHGKIDLAKWLVNNYKIDIHEPNGNEYAFRYSCENGHLKLTKWLVELALDKRYSDKKIDIHSSDEDAFLKACENGHLELAKWLVELALDKRYSDKKIDIHADNDYVFKKTKIPNVFK